MRIKHNLEQQIQARNQSGVSEDALKEFSMMFRYVLNFTWGPSKGILWVQRIITKPAF